MQRPSLEDYRLRHHIADRWLERIRRRCVQKDIALDDAAFAADRSFIRNRLKAEVARLLWNNEGYYYIWLDSDTQFKSALTSFRQARQLAALESR